MRRSRGGACCLRTRAHTTRGTGRGLPLQVAPAGPGCGGDTQDGAKIPGPRRHARCRCLLIRSGDATPSRHLWGPITSQGSDGRTPASRSAMTLTPTAEASSLPGAETCRSGANSSARRVANSGALRSPPRSCCGTAFSLEPHWLPPASPDCLRLRPASSRQRTPPTFPRRPIHSARRRGSPEHLRRGWHDHEPTNRLRFKAGPDGCRSRSPSRRGRLPRPTASPIRATHSERPRCRFRHRHR